ncbi:MAG TPA: AgmX/PglI C-terminal domain-containing protein [Kofleriaceae bacterium]|jgi:hypothetical protein
MRALVLVLLGCAVAHADVKMEKHQHGAVEIKAPQIKGALVAKTVRAAMEKRKLSLVRCYKTALESHPELTDTVSLDVEIKPSGSVDVATASGTDDALAACVQTAVTQWVFPSPTSGPSAHVQVDLSFFLGDGGERPVVSYANERPFERQHGSDAVGGTAVPTTTIGSFSVTGTLSKDLLRRYLRRNVARLEFCYERELFAADPFEGSSIVKLSIDARGVATPTSIAGLGNVLVEDCVHHVIENIELTATGMGEGTATVKLTFAMPRVASPRHGHAAGR